MLYVDYPKKEMGKQQAIFTEKQEKYVQAFGDHLLEGIQYYRTPLPRLEGRKQWQTEHMKQAITEIERTLKRLMVTL